MTRLQSDSDSAVLNGNLTPGLTLFCSPLRAWPLARHLQSHENFIGRWALCYSPMARCHGYLLEPLDRPGDELVQRQPQDRLGA
jgi:hypothetical protein